MSIQTAEYKRIARLLTETFSVEWHGGSPNKL